jgi:hypothetical protein
LTFRKTAHKDAAVCSSLVLPAAQGKSVLVVAADEQLREAGVAGTPRDWAEWEQAMAAVKRHVGPGRHRHVIGGVTPPHRHGTPRQQRPDRRAGLAEHAAEFGHRSTIPGNVEAAGAGGVGHAGEQIDRQSAGTGRGMGRSISIRGMLGHGFNSWSAARWRW